MKYKLGRFRVSRQLIDQAINEPTSDLTAGWCAIFGKCIVIETTHRYDRCDILYLAYCEDFEPIEQGTEAPEYMVTISRAEGYVGHERVFTFDAKFTRITP